MLKILVLKMQQKYCVKNFSVKNAKNITVKNTNNIMLNNLVLKIHFLATISVS